VKFTIQQSELGKALTNVASIVPAKTTMPILTCVLVDATEDTITFSATNLDLSVTTNTTDASITMPGKVAIPAQKFISFVRSLSNGEVIIEVENGILSVKSGKLEMSATGTDGSRAEDEMAVSFDGEAMEIGFNYSYLLDVLKNIDAKEIVISVKDSQSAALLAPATEDEKNDLLCLLMPLRLSSD